MALQRFDVTIEEIQTYQVSIADVVIQNVTNLGGGAVDSVNGNTGVVVLDSDDIDEGVTNLYLTEAERIKLASVASGADVSPVASVNAKTGTVVLDPDDLDDTSTAHKFTTAAEIAKLAGIEANATADQTAPEIKALYESNADTNVFDDAAQTKLAGIEANAKDDQTGAEIKALYEAETNTNAFTDAYKTKLDGIAPNADVSPISSVNGHTGVVVLDPDDLDDTTTTNKFTTAADIAKLAGVEDNATADQSASEIKSLYESNANTNAFTDAEQTKLGNIEDNATADQTGAEIKALYEGEADTNAFTDAEQTKLGYITITQAVDLDAMETRVNALDAAVVLSGEFAPSLGSFPGGGTAQAGQSYFATDTGTIDGKTINTDDRVIALVDNASTTDSADWHVSVYTDQVLSVAGKTGAVTLVLADITDAGVMAGKDSVGTTDIDNDAVTFPKLQNIATSTILGRTTAGSGDVEQLTDLQTLAILGVEPGATADQTGAEIKALYEAEANTNAFTDTEKSKLAGISPGADVSPVSSVNTQTGAVVLDADDISDAGATHKFTTAGDISKLAGIEDNATADQTAGEIKTLYESNLDTNAFTDDEKTKLAGIAPGADVSPVTSVAGKTGVVTLVVADLTDAGALAALDTVNTLQIDDGAVSRVKMANMTANTIMGRAGTTGQPQELDAVNARLILNVEDGAQVNTITSVNSQTGAVVLDADDISDTSTTHKFATAAEKTKIGYLTITQPVDLDALESRVDALDQVVILKGNFDPSGGVFPGGGTAQAGESWISTGTGTIDGMDIAVDDRVIAISDNASTVSAADWHKSDNTDKVLSVAGQTGAVTLSYTDIAGLGDLAILDQVDQAQIAANAVHFSEFQQISTQRFLGRNSGGDGNVEQISPTTLLTMIGVEPGAQVNTVDSVAGKTGIVTLTVADITDAGALAALDTINTTNMVDNAVTFAKMQNVTGPVVVGRQTASSGDPSALSMTTLRTMLNVENGATADQTGAEIKALYEAEPNAFTDADRVTIDGLGVLASLNYKRDSINLGSECDTLDVWGPTNGPWTVETITDGKVGNKCLQILDNNDDSDNLFGNSFPIDENVTYKVSVWARQPDGDRRNYFLCNFIRGDGTQIIANTDAEGLAATGWLNKGGYFYWGVNNQVITTDWTKYEITFGPNGTADIPEGARSLSIGGLFARVGGTLETRVQLQDFRVDRYIEPGNTDAEIQTAAFGYPIPATREIVKMLPMSSAADYFAQFLDGTKAANSKVGTFACWVYLDSIASDQIIFDTYLAGGFRLYYDQSAGEFVAVAGNSGTPASGTKVFQITSDPSTPPAAATLYHIHVHWDVSTSDIKMYVNGVDQAQAATSVNDLVVPWSDATVFAIGIDAAGSNYDFAGEIGQLYLNIEDAVTDNAEFYAAGEAVFLGTSGVNPSGAKPAVIMTGVGEGYSWHNEGYLGDFFTSFTITGYGTHGPSTVAIDSVVVDYDDANRLARLFDGFMEFDGVSVTATSTQVDLYASDKMVQVIDPDDQGAPYVTVMLHDIRPGLAYLIKNAGTYNDDDSLLQIRSASGPTTMAILAPRQTALVACVQGTWQTLAVTSESILQGSTYATAALGDGSHAKNLGSTSLGFAAKSEGLYATALGYLSWASADYSLARGPRAKAVRKGEEYSLTHTIANEYRADDQTTYSYSRIGLWAQSVDSATATMKTNGPFGTTYIALPESKNVLAFSGLVVCYNPSSENGSGFEIKGVIRRNASGTVSFGGTPSVTSIGVAGAETCTLTADDTNKGLKIEVASSGFGGLTTHWSGYVEFAEVSVA